MENIEVEERCSVHKMNIDEIGFIYRHTNIEHRPDGVAVVTLSGESLISGKPMYVSFDARTAPADRFKKLRSGDFLEFHSFSTDGNA